MQYYIIAEIKYCYVHQWHVRILCMLCNVRLHMFSVQVCSWRGYFLLFCFRWLSGSSGFQLASNIYITDARLMFLVLSADGSCVSITSGINLSVAGSHMICNCFSHMYMVSGVKNFQKKKQRKNLVRNLQQLLRPSKILRVSGWENIHEKQHTVTQIRTL